MKFLLIDTERGYVPHFWHFCLFFVLFFTNQMNFRGSEYITGGNLDIQVFIRLAVLGGVGVICALYYKDFVACLRDIPLFFHGLLLLFLLVVTCMPWTFDFYSVYALVTHLLLFYVVVVLVVRCGFENSLYYYVAGVSIFCLVSLIFYYVIPDVGRYSYWDERNIYFQSTRMSGIASHPNSLGFMAATGILGLLHLICIRYPFHKILYVGGVVIFLCLVLTDSRTSMAGTFFMVVTYLSIYFRIFSLTALGIVLSGAFVFLSFQFSWGILFDALQLVSRSGNVEEITSLTGRSHVWEQMMVLIERRPFFGWGHATMGRVLAEYKQEIGFEVGQAHNLYLQIMFAGGLIGFFVYILNIFSALFVSVLQALESKTAFSFCILLYILIASFTEAFMLSSVANNAYLVFVMCLTALSVECQKRRRTRGS